MLMIPLIMVDATLRIFGNMLANLVARSAYGDSDGPMEEIVERGAIKDGIDENFSERNRQIRKAAVRGVKTRDMRAYKHHLD